MKKPLPCILFALALCLAMIPSISFGNDVILLENIIDEALKNNPQLHATEDHIAALDQKAGQASSLPNPMLSFGLMNVPVDTFDLDQEAMTQKTIGIMQSFPFPGKRGLKKEIAEMDVLRSEEDREILKLWIAKEMKKSFYSLYFTNKALEITKRNKELLEEFLRIAETKYSVGRGVQQDILKAQVELSKLLERIISLREKRNSLKARLNHFMNRLPQLPLGDPGEIRLSEIDISVDQLQQTLGNEHPLIKKIQARIDMEKKKLKLAEREYYPDINLSLQYGQREDKGTIDRPDFASAMVQVKLPIWHKTREGKKIKEVTARVSEAENELRFVRSSLNFRIVKLKEEMDRDHEQALLFKDGIIPQATASLDSAVAGYQVNKVDFLTLLNNQITLFKYEIEYMRAITDHEITLAEMEEAVGLPIVDWGLWVRIQAQSPNPKLDNEVTQ
ncbi:MAG: TolC family protein [Proteobacteria bacterium]|nr:TolC family protein [Pseudomonadota bacterium]